MRLAKNAPKTLVWPAASLPGDLASGSSQEVKYEEEMRPIELALVPNWLEELKAKMAATR